MKSQIIQLEAHDDIISTRDKLGTAQASRIILMWPPKNKAVLNNKLDLILLHRYSEQLGVQLGLVTASSEIRALATEIGIPIFRSRRSAQTGRWRTTRRKGIYKDHLPKFNKKVGIRRPILRREQSWWEKSIPRILIFSISLAAILALVVVILPGAEIQVFPEKETISINLDVRANPELDQPLLAGELPVQTATIIVEGRKSKAASGSIEIPEKPATGQVEFRNLTENSVEVPAGTIVTTLDSPAIRFATLQTVIVPAGIGSSKTANIQAQIPGRTGNLAPGQIQAIEGSLGLSLTATNPSATSQGSFRTSTAPSQADRDELHQQLFASLEQSAAHELQSRIPTNGTIADFPLILTLDLRRVIEETYQPAGEQPADHVELLLRVEFSYQYISAQHLEAFAQPILNANLQEGYQSVPDTTRFIHTQPSKVDNQDFISWKLTLSQLVQKKIASEQIASESRGITIRNAINRLQSSFNFSIPPVINVSPSWWPFLPILPYRISVSIQS
jgi:hypothetical protein